MQVETTAAGRARAFALSPAWFLRLAALELFALWVIVATGAAVRLTSSGLGCRHWPGCEAGHPLPAKDYHAYIEFGRSEEHTSELQSLTNLVCRLLLEKKKKQHTHTTNVV